MRKVQTILIISGLLFMVNLAIGQEFALSNPGFEDGDLTGWGLWPTTGTQQEVSSDVTHTGTYSLKMNGTTVAASQGVTVPATGRLILVEGFAMNSATDTLVAGQELRLEITYFDAAWGVITQHFSKSITHETTAGEWQTLFVAGMVPDGAVNVNVAFNWVGTGDAGTAGTAYCDDMRAFEIRGEETIWTNLGFETEELIWDSLQVDWDGWHSWAYEPLNIPAEQIMDPTTAHTGDYACVLRPQEWDVWGDPWWWGGYWGNVGQSISPSTDSVTIVEGDAFYLSAWLMTPWVESIMGNASVGIELQFKDEATNTRILQTLSDVSISESSTADEWYFVEAYGILPPGVDKVDMDFVMGQYGDAEGVVYVDDAFFGTSSALDPWTPDDPDPPLAGVEQLHNTGFGSDSSWTAYQLNLSVAGTIDFNYTADGPAEGEGPALNFAGGTDAHVLVAQEVELIAGETYAVDGAIKDISAETMSCNWIQLYVSTQVPVEGEDYAPAGDQLIGFDSWGSATGVGVDGTFAVDGMDYAGNVFVAPGTPGEAVTMYFALKSGSCGSAFDLLFDDLSLLLIEDSTEVTIPGTIDLANASFETGDLTDWGLWPTSGTSQTASTDTFYTGENSLKMMGPDVAVYQGSNMIEPGAAYAVSGMFLNPSADPMLEGQACRIEITFFDASWSTLLQVYSDPITSASALDVWQELSVSAVCPDGVANINVGFNWLGADGASGAAFCDDLEAYWGAIPAEITNLGFEDEEDFWSWDTDAGWSIWAYEPLNDGVSWDSTMAHSGTKSVKIYSQDWVTWGDPWGWWGYWGGISQWVMQDEVTPDIVEGDWYYVSAWVYNPADDPLTGNIEVYTEMKYQDSGGGNISTANTDFKVVPESSEDTWHHIFVMSEAPAGDIAWIETNIYVGQYDVATGHVFADDFIVARLGDPVPTGIADQPVEIPHEMQLSQNYPNPFNPSTQIAFSLTHREHVTLKVFDLLGREVATLVDGVQAEGVHDVTFNANHLASGLYFYRLTSESGSLTHKMLLNK